MELEKHYGKLKLDVLKMISNNWSVGSAVKLQLSIKLAANN